MTKFEIKTDSFEFRFYTRTRDELPAMTAAEILETYQSGDTRITSNSLDPETVGSFDSLEDAKKAFARFYANYGRTAARRADIGYNLAGELAWIEENEFDDDGEFIQGGVVYDYSAEPYEPEE